MAPIATHAQETLENLSVQAEEGFKTKARPIKPTGALDHLEQVDLTPVIGREFPTANLVDILNAPNADELLTELAYLSMTSTSIASSSYLTFFLSLLPRCGILQETIKPDQQSPKTTNPTPGRTLRKTQGLHPPHSSRP